jgi:hypothetical protein
MEDDLIAHIRDRIERLRKVLALAHNAEMMAMLEGLIRDAEADIARIEANQIQVRPTQN